MIDGAIDGVELLRGAKLLLLIDWPDRDVPDTLARSGFSVVSDEGPGRGYTAYEANGDDILTRSVEAPARADVVYVHRPIDELPALVERARAMGARAVWLQSGLDSEGRRDPKASWLPQADSDRAREIIESAGLAYVQEPYIADAARAMG